MARFQLIMPLLIEDFEERQYKLPRQDAGRSALSDGPARPEAEGPRGCLRNAKYCVGSIERQARVEQGSTFRLIPSSVVFAVMFS